MKTGNLPTAQYPQEILRSEDVLGILALFAGQRIIQWQPLKTAFKVIGFRKHTDILVFGALVRSIWLPPGGKLSSAARLMRNGETDRFCIQFVKKVQFEKLYVLI